MYNAWVGPLEAGACDWDEHRGKRAGARVAIRNDPGGFVVENIEEGFNTGRGSFFIDFRGVARAKASESAG